MYWAQLNTCDCNLQFSARSSGGNIFPCSSLSTFSVEEHSPRWNAARNLPCRMGWSDWRWAHPVCNLSQIPWSQVSKKGSSKMGNHLIWTFPLTFLQLKKVPMFLPTSVIQIPMSPYLLCLESTCGVPKMGAPQKGWFIMENPIKMDHLGVPLF